MAADGEVGGCERRLVGVGEVELQGDVGERGEEVRIGCCDAGCVEEGCFGADGGGCSGCVGAAGVVLCSAADGDVF